jgi:uncharacterized protein (DUF2126 family)
MSIHVALHHATRYRYDRLVGLGPQLVALRPAPHARTRVLSYSLRVGPEPHFLHWQQDPHGNFLARLTFPERVQELTLEVDLVLEMAVVNPFDFFLEPRAEQWPFAYDPAEMIDLAAFREGIVCSPLLTEYVRALSRAEQRTVDMLVELNRRLAEEIRYVVRLEPGVQTPDETLLKRSGSCRDSAWLLVQILRHLGFAARFVSGYLVQLVADEKPLEGPAGPSADFTDLHAWCEVFLPGAGWIGLDPTSGLLAGEGHVPLACAIAPDGAAPVRGGVDPCEVAFEHEMRVTRIHETPRVTKPYDDDAWAAILAAGAAVDRRLEAGDVRLTMGGEPTFVSIDDRDGPEWNGEAVSAKKRALSVELFRRLRAKHAPQGLAHFGQGKWYPGEQLPRFALSCFWRKDGEPLWTHEDAWAREERPAGSTAADGERFLGALAEALAVDPARAFPVFEDAFYYLWRERRLPSNVDPHDARLDDPLERDRLRRVFDRGLDAVVGHVLPLTHDGAGFRTGRWFLRSERCYLLPGDSPVGYRLPLDSMPWVPEGDRTFFPPIDPSAPRHALPPREQLRGPLRGRAERGLSNAPESQGSTRTEPLPADVVRTALCAEARGGTLYVFMPPMPTLEAYLSLAHTVEDVAHTLHIPVILEGYEPPRDGRLHVFRITPDPGVIEANVHPVATFEEAAANTVTLYEAARESRLGAEKFMLDGRHTGTGGGNHLVLGGETPQDSPFLRRPDLLRSLLLYWNDHPSLSTLFSGLFIGPTSQAPRIDEARQDALFELEVACAELDRQRARHGADVPPWLVDRLFRNLLVDATGNTHRTELCIDKLYSPDGPTGRLGLVELRALEMPPHARMSVAQQLLVRALVARFWDTPYAPRHAQRWGTALHDRFMLPHWVWSDFEDVCHELQGAGLPIAEAWFRPHAEFRFPVVGDLAAAGVHLELRAALEPWHVLGEEGAVGGTVRYVDSSLERLQVKASGLPGDRYAVTCNGVEVPLHPTGTVGEAVAGVRYRAWQPPSCLHPTIPVDTPLTFDLVDRWNGRSVAGCTYHVAHPGGRNYDTFPVNAFEAESRRRARFFRHGHTPGPLVPRQAPPSREHPFTLDLRRVD